MRDHLLGKDFFFENDFKSIQTGTLYGTVTAPQSFATTVFRQIRWFSLNFREEVV